MKSSASTKPPVEVCPDYLEELTAKALAYDNAVTAGLIPEGNMTGTDAATEEETPEDGE